jgi:hypothetical protein
MNLPSKTLRICFSGDDYVRTATCRSSPRAVWSDPQKVIQVLREDLARSGSGGGGQNESQALQTGTDHRDRGQAMLVSPYIEILFSSPKTLICERVWDRRVIA